MFIDKGFQIKTYQMVICFLQQILRDLPYTNLEYFTECFSSHMPLRLFFRDQIYL